MLSTVSLVFFPPKQQPQKGKFQNNQTHQWNKTCEETSDATRVLSQTRQKKVQHGKQ